MSDEAAFLRAIQADPADATAKLVYADWLDERGEAWRANYVRLDAHATPGPPPALRPTHDAWLCVYHAAVPVWGPVTMLALGRLQGLLTGLVECSDNATDITYEFRADLVVRSDGVHELAERHFGPDRLPVRLEPLADWAAELERSVYDHVLDELAHVRGAHSRLALETEGGRAGLVRHVVQHVRSVLRPTGGWRARATPHIGAITWDDLLLEAADRVLFLHFSRND